MRLQNEIAQLSIDRGKNHLDANFSRGKLFRDIVMGKSSDNEIFLFYFACTRVEMKKNRHENYRFPIKRSLDGGFKAFMALLMTIKR